MEIGLFVCMFIKRKTAYIKTYFYVDKVFEPSSMNIMD